MAANLVESNRAPENSPFGTPECHLLFESRFERRMRAPATMGLQDFDLFPGARCFSVDLCGEIVSANP